MPAKKQTNKQTNKQTKQNKTKQNKTNKQRKGAPLLGLAKSIYYANRSNFGKIALHRKWILSSTRAKRFSFVEFSRKLLVFTIIFVTLVYNISFNRTFIL